MTRCAVLIATFCLMVSADASASVIPAAMRDAVDAYATSYAEDQGWTYTDRQNGRGDYRRASFTLVFVTDVPCKGEGCDGTMPFTWNIEARAVKCGPGWYAVSVPGRKNTCRRPVLPVW